MATPNGSLNKTRLPCSSNGPTPTKMAAEMSSSESSGDESNSLYSPSEADDDSSNLDTEYEESDNAEEVDGNNSTCLPINIPEQAVGLEEPVVNEQNANAEPSKWVKKRTRKRTRQPDSWIKNIKKKKRNSGSEYLNVRGKLVAEKVFNNKDCKCRKKCFQKISEENRKAIFSGFWRIGDCSKQNAYLCGLVKRNSVQRRRSKNNTRNPKGCSNQFTLPCNNDTTVVCRKYFEETFQISHGRLMRLLASFKDTQTPGQKKKALQAPNKTDKAVVDKVNEHIGSFPAYESHYSREKNPNRKYLHPDLNVRKMYGMYLVKCTEDGVTNPVKESFYRNIFSTQHNLHFHAPRTDTCKQCDKFHIQSEACDNEVEKTALTTAHELHLRKAEKARKCMQADTELCKNSDEIYGMSFDLQKALPFPKLSVSVAYYKRNMYVYNLGIHEFKTGNVFMYVWDETTASRGSQEIAACLNHHLNTYAAGKKHVIMYSDCCGGQNRNIKIAVSMLKFVTQANGSVDVIDHKFLVPGHTFLPNDADFGLIEAAGRKQSCIFVPKDWYKIIAEARKKNPYKVICLEASDVVSTKSLEQNITNRKETVDRKKLNWLKMQWMRYERSLPTSMQFKETNESAVEFQTVSFQKRTRGRTTALRNIPQEVLYKGCRPVTAKKKNDMKDLLDYIPPIHHQFFNNLTIRSEESDSDN